MASLIERYAPPDIRGKRRLKGHYALFRDASRSPSQKEVSLGTRDAPTARARLADMERREAQGLYDPWTDPPPWKVRIGSGMTVDEAVEQFLKDRARTNGDVGLANYRAVLAPFLRSLPPGLLLAHLGASHVEGWTASRQVRPSSLRSYRDRLGIFFRWCVESKRVAPTWNPMTEAATAKDRKALEAPPPKYFTPEDLARLLARVDEAGRGAGQSAALDRLLADVIRFTAATGLRRGEVCALRWSAVHLGARDEDPSFVAVEPSEGFTTKNGKRRVVPLLGSALAVLRERAGLGTHAPDDPVFPAVHHGKNERPGRVYGPMLTRRLREHLGALGLRSSAGGPPPNFHSLRHTFGTEAVSGGASVYAVQEAMGHGRIQTTQGYAKVRPVALHAELAKVFKTP